MFHLYFRNNLVSVDNEDRSIKSHISSFVLKRFLRYFYFNINDLIFNELYIAYIIFFVII